MYLSKDYQTSLRLQAIYNVNNATSKLFLSICNRCPQGKWGWLARKPLANDAGVSERHQSRLVQDLIKLGVIEKQAHGTNRSHYSAYKVTEFGYQVKQMFEKIYNANKYLIFSVSLLLSPVKTHVPLLSYNVVIKEVSSSSSYCKLQTAPARETQNNQILQTTARKEVDVGSKEHINMDLPEHVVSLTPLLQLTTHGQLKLAAFDKETVDSCWAAVQQSSGCKDIFKELANLCVQYCKDNDIRPDWPFYYDGIKSGFAGDKDRYTNKVITSAMIKPRVVVDSNGSASQALLMKIEQEKMRQKQKDWEAKRGATHVQNTLRLLAPDVKEYMQDAGASQDALEAVRVHTLSEIQTAAPKPDVLSEAQIAAIDNKVDFVRKMRDKENMNGFELILYNAFKAEIRETQLKFGTYDRWNVDESPSWSQSDNELIDWTLGYINSMTHTRDAYVPIEQEILLGPDSPRAKTGELQEGLRLMKSLVYGTYQPPVERVVTELKDQIVCAQIANDELAWENMKYSLVDDGRIFEEVMD